MIDVRSQTARIGGREQYTVTAHTVTSIISETVKSILSAKYGVQLRALILTGSMSRSELALLSRDSRSIRVLGDADLIAVFDDATALPTKAELTAVCKNAEHQAVAKGVSCSIGISATYATFLRQSRPSIFTYELLTRGTVVCGDPSVLSLIPAVSIADIPLEDAWRTLCNRMIELLEVLDVSSPNCTPTGIECQYRIVKLWLEMATSFLLFAGAYAPSYRERAENLQALSLTTTNERQWPFSLADFCSLVMKATSWRTEVIDEYTAAAGVSDPITAVHYARLIWRWELSRLTNTSLVVSDRQLWQKLLFQHSLRSNIRGWFHIIRVRGPFRSLRHLPRWITLARAASPRLYIYGIGSELLFDNFSLSSYDRLDRSVDYLSWLPERRETLQACTWKTLAADIVWNYKELLMDTRS